MRGLSSRSSLPARCRAWPDSCSGKSSRECRARGGLACNIDEAVGAYAVLIYAVLGPIIFAVTLGIARNRRALAGATSVLIAPLLVFFGVASIETCRSVGFCGYSELGEILGAVMPP